MHSTVPLPLETVEPWARAGTMQMDKVDTIGLVSCAGAKRATPALAKDLYQSDRFRKARAYAGRPFGADLLSIVQVTSDRENYQPSPVCCFTVKFCFRWHANRRWNGGVMPLSLVISTIRASMSQPTAITWNIICGLKCTTA